MNSCPSAIGPCDPGDRMGGGQWGEHRAVVVLAGVGAAQPGADDPQPDLSRPGRGGRRPLLDPQIARGVQDGGSHAPPPLAMCTLTLVAVSRAAS